MAQRNTSSKIALVGIPLVVAMALAATVWRLWGPSASDAEEWGQPSTAAPVSAGPSATADTPWESIQSLASGQSQLQDRLDGVSGQVRDTLSMLEQQVRELTADLGRSQAEQAQRLVETENRITLVQEEIVTSVDDLENRLTGEYPVIDLRPDGAPESHLRADGLIWFAATTPEPTPSTPRGLGALTALTEPISGLGGADNTLLSGSRDEWPPPIPALTIPAEATLVRSRGLTALIGRVPSEGQVSDPLPFKVITGADNLLANGQTLPEIAQAIWTGTAIGDRTLHCVSGRLHQVTFVFADGTLATWPEADGDDSLGWISDEQGWPCVPGRFVSNLDEALGKLSASAAASGLAQAWAERQVTTAVEGQSITRTVTGNPVDFALAHGVRRGLDEWARVMAQRAADTFDVVVVPPGQTLTVHVRRAIPIDWSPDGRRIRHLVATPRPWLATPGGLD